MKKIISVMHCFDKRYVLPAAACFQSMLMNSSAEYNYKLYVLHTDISIEDQNKLNTVVNSFKNASLFFVTQNNLFTDLFNDLRVKGHYSKEMFYKLITPLVFPDLDLLIVTDVDVLFLGDVSKPYEEFQDKTDFYIGGVKGLIKKNSWVEKCSITQYSNDFSKEDQIKLSNIGAGFMIFNLKLMRDHDITKKFLNTAKSNLNKLRQPEQDVINLVCYPKIYLFKPRTMVCTYNYDLYRTEDDYGQDIFYSKEVVKDTLSSPIQLHYAGPTKPWNSPKTTHGLLWYKYIFRTVFVNEFVEIMKKWANRTN